MKTKSNMQKSCIMAVAFAISFCGGYISAQSDLEEFRAVEMNNALIRLDDLMKNLEMGIRYKAPIEVEEDTNFVLDRLEALFDKQHKEIIYKTPCESEIEVFSPEPDQLTEEKLAYQRTRNHKNRGRL